MIRDFVRFYSERVCQDMVGQIWLSLAGDYALIEVVDSM